MASRPIVRGGEVGAVLVAPALTVVSVVRRWRLRPVSGSGGDRLGTVVRGRAGVVVASSDVAEPDVDADADAPDPGRGAAGAQAKRETAASSGCPSVLCQPTTASTRPCGNASAYRAVDPSSHTRAPIPAPRSWSATEYAAVTARSSVASTPSVRESGTSSRCQRGPVRAKPAPVSARSVSAGSAVVVTADPAGKGWDVTSGRASPVTTRPITCGSRAAATARRTAGSDTVGATVLNASSSWAVPANGVPVTPGTVSETSLATGVAETRAIDPGPSRRAAPSWPGPVARRTTICSISGAPAQ